VTTAASYWLRFCERRSKGTGSCGPTVNLASLGITVAMRVSMAPFAESVLTQGVSETLERAGMVTTLSGGAAVSIYSDNKY